MHRLLSFICVGLACSVPNPEVAVDTDAEVIDSRTDSIVDGEPTNNDEPAVVAVLNRAGGLCTGTLIAPRVVLTARHCVQFEGSSGPSLPSLFVIGIGDNINRLSQTFGASDVVTTDGPYRRINDIIGKDIALITLTTQPDITPIPVERESASAGQMMRAVGFGQRPDGDAGLKYRTTTRVSFMDGGVIYSPPTICQGDSGGPMLTLDETVVGVASFGNASSCGSGTNGHNRVDIWLDMIDEAIRASGVCVGDGTEVCDGEDNDCDELFDEDCSAVGDPCTADDECITLTCRDVDGTGRICTQGCDPQRPMTSCPPGMYCGDAEGSCDGFCTPGEAGTLPNDADCSSDTECASLFCRDPGDGRARCLNPCRGDEGMCLDGEACAAGAGSCSGCVPAEIVVGSRGLGEPCASEADCSSAMCLMEAGGSYCTRACVEGLDCPSGYHCRLDGESGACVRGEAGGVGTPCLANGDCEESLFCATRGDESWCTSVCEDAMDCPESFSCVAAGDVSVCAPDSGIVGAECETGADCISGNCQPIGPGGELLCTRFCGPESQCQPGFSCVRSSDGITNVCVPTEEEGGGGGGGCSASGTGAGSWLMLFGLLAWRRKR